ncbi:MAG TPA: DUF6152 family protein [Gammaproteobacteria bacterium]|nr:DUF6152 family protein [Gammaproteobacteria bacterium]
MRSTRLMLLALLAAFAAPAAGHHSPAAFDRSTAAVLRGEVTRYDWKNPHVYIFVAGTDDSGQTGEWLVEADPTPLMTRSGWTASTVAPGDVVSIRMWPDRDPQRLHGLLVTLTKDDGTTLGMRAASPTDAASAASGISGVWDALPDFSVPIVDQDTNPPRSFTEAGLRARAGYDPGQNPMASCLAYPTPMLTVLPYLNEIEILDDRVLIKSELNGVVRTVYTDGRDHPADGPRTIQGHSIGRWEGQALVVDTRLFADYRLAHGRGIPSGAQKHTIERYALSPDRTRLDIEIRVEDPEFVVAPYTVSTSWKHAPERTLEPFDCDPENAGLFYAR